ncbi:hypothetical protein CCMSSC00406_0008685 [Pleurotus cornucopiae]|uniref:Uncharacterized protein n=1 Tax=Pleurotus cornucopiae TaxID=5321 RepID=A0ACB7J837_PLECO|nr:hypothetical protein CCMSSC00406_0008685 [Pleurotus cornucopiae]
MQVSFWSFIKAQWAQVPPVEKHDLTGKTVVVIGANTGIGYETAKHFAMMNPARLIMGCRNREKGAAAVGNLEESTGFDKAELWLIDLCSFESVKAFVDKLDKDVERLDILVSNAAVMPMEYARTEDNWETSLQVNYLAPALLILLLLPKMFQTVDTSTSEPRVVIVSSETHQNGKIPDEAFQSASALEVFNDRQFCQPYNHLERYRLTKLLTVLLTLALTDHLPSDRRTIIVDCVNPGFCYSEIRRGIHGVLRVAMMQLLEKLLAKTAEEGARQVIWGSIATPREGVNSLKGAYVSSARITEPSDFVISEKGKQFSDILWNDTVRILSKVDPRVQATVEQYMRQ